MTHIDSSTVLSNQPSFVHRPPSPTLSPQNIPPSTLPAPDPDVEQTTNAPSQSDDMIFGNDDSLEENTPPPQIAQSQESRLMLRNKIASKQPIHSIPAVVLPCMDTANRVNQAAVEALQQVSTLYADHLAGTAESFIAKYPRVFVSQTERPLSTLEYLAGPYVRTLFFPMNLDMRHGKVDLCCSQLFKDSLWGDVASEPRKTHIAHLQEAIKNSPDRVTEDNCVVYRVSHCPNDFIGLLDPESIGEGIFLVNRSFLSTSPHEGSFDPGSSAFGKVDPKEVTLLTMSIRLGLETPILDLHTRGLSYEKESEILLPAGIAFQVEGYNPDSKHLVLKEVSPGSIHGELYTTIL